MSENSGTMLVVAFGDVEKAEDALAAVHELSLRDAAVVVRTEAGRVELHQTSEIAPGEGIVGGGAIGLLAGLVLGLPVGGALLGLVGGAGFGLRDTGIPNRRLRRLGEELQPGHAVLCVLAAAGDEVAARQALARYGEVLETGVSTAAEP